MIFAQNNISHRILARLLDGRGGNIHAISAFTCDMDARQFIARDLRVDFDAIESITLEYIVPKGHSKHVQDLPDDARPSQIIYFSTRAEFHYSRRDALTMLSAFKQALGRPITQRTTVSYQDTLE